MPTSQPLKLWIPLDGGHVSDRAVFAACTLFAPDGRFPPLTEVRLVRIVHPHEANDEAREEHAGEDAPLQVRAASAQHHLDRLTEALEKRGAVVDTRVRMSEDPPAGLVEDMLETDPTLILMTSHARDGLSRWTHGSVTETVLRQAVAPVIVLPEGRIPGADDLGPLLVALDGSRRAERVLGLATNLARFLGIGLVLVRSSEAPGVPLQAQLTSYPTPEPIQLSDAVRADEAWDYLQRLEAELVQEGLSVKGFVTTGKPADAILNAAEVYGAGLLALTTHGHTGLSRLLMGSIAEDVIRKARRPLLVLRTGELDPGHAAEKQLAGLRAE